MSVNKYKPHVWVIPEDDADRQLVLGFQQHHSVNIPKVGVNPPAGGWEGVLNAFEREFIPYLRKYSEAFVVMVIDFDERVEERRSRCEQRIPEDLKSRVFVIGTFDEPEELRTGLRMSFETIGRELAESCDREDLGQLTILPSSITIPNCSGWCLSSNRSFFKAAKLMCAEIICICWSDMVDS